MSMATFRRPVYAAAFPLVLLASAAVQLVVLWRAFHRSDALIARACRFERRLAAPRGRVLLLGDSTGVGVGADHPDESLAGLLAADYPDIEIVNDCLSGARVADVLQQATRRSTERYDLVILQVGANDVLHATDFGMLAADTQTLLQVARGIAPRAVWLSTANIGLAPLFVPPFSWWISSSTRRARAIFAAAAERAHVEFVDFFRERRDDPFSRDAKRYYAPDRLHPTSASYRHCYHLARERISLPAALDDAEAA
jgi:lysophospholipase L1-like esterase